MDYIYIYIWSTTTSWINTTTTTTILLLNQYYNCNKNKIQQKILFVAQQTIKTAKIKNKHILWSVMFSVVYFPLFFLSLPHPLTLGSQRHVSEHCMITRAWLLQQFLSCICELMSCVEQPSGASAATVVVQQLNCSSAQQEWRPLSVSRSVALQTSSCPAGGSRKSPNSSMHTVHRGLHVQPPHCWCPR